MDGLMAVLAGVFDRPAANRGHARCWNRGAGEAVGPVIERSRVPRIQVAALAKEGTLRHQELVVVRTVGVVAVRAVLSNRSVLPKVGASLLGVAGEAGVVHGCGLQQLGLGSVMRIVATRAIELAFANRVMRGAVHLGPDLRVAAVAVLRVTDRLQLSDGGLEVVDAVARDATHVLAVVNAAREVHLVAFLVAAGAGRGYLPRRQFLDRRPRRLLAIGAILSMFDGLGPVVAADATAFKPRMLRLLELRHSWFMTSDAVRGIEGFCLYRLGLEHRGRRGFGGGIRGKAKKTQAQKAQGYRP